MDNVIFHKNIVIKRLIEDSGHKIMFVPPYSPDFNPIENMFAKWKNYVKRRNPKTENELAVLIDEGLSQITPSDCESFWLNMTKFVRMYY